MKFQLLLVTVIAVVAVDSRYSTGSPKSHDSPDGDQGSGTHRKLNNIPEGQESADYAQKLKNRENDDLGSPIFLKEFSKDLNDSTVVAPPPGPQNDRENSWESQDSGNDVMGPPISPEEFAEVQEDPTKAPTSETEILMENSADYQGDIRLTPKQRAHIKEGRIATSPGIGLWNNGVIPYTISSVFTGSERLQIARAMLEFQKRTCLWFTGRTTQTDYIYIISDSRGCWSMVGRTGGMQKLSIRKNGCVHFGIIIHEFMHAAGFWHEQSSHNRDNYISVHLENIRDDKQHNFYKGTSNKDLGLQYDYHSIMHYRAHSFSKNGRQTITPKEEGVTIGQRNGFSELDVKGLNLLYKCEDGGSCVGGVSIGGQCLVFSQGKRTWADAKATCEADGNKFASLDDPEAVLAYIKGKFGNTHFNVGGSDAAKEGSWRWLNGKPIPSDPAWFPWANGEPNNNGNQDCLSINWEGGFDDTYCHSKNRYICEVGNKVVKNCAPCVRIGGDCLLFSHCALSWADAKATCEADGNKLASPADPEAVLAYVKGKFGGVNFFLGGTDAAREGSWRWLNGKVIPTDRNYFPWGNGEPNNAGGEDCLVAYGWGGYFNDIPCSWKRRYICEVA